MKLVLICLLAWTVTGVPMHKPKIVGGSDVTYGDIPYQVSLQDGSFGYYKHLCGGVIYNENYVITSAGCAQLVNISFPQHMRAMAGEHTLYALEGYEQPINVESVIVHKDYSASAYTDDIALFKLKGNFIFDAYVSPIPLAADGQESSGFCVASGWGLTSEDGVSAASVLQSVNLPLVSDENCKIDYGSGNILDSMMCAGAEGLGTCEGDLGGPLACQDGSGTYLAGIESWGYGCARAGYPAVFTQISYYVDWITNNAV